jgi:hypothetical protein
MEIKINLNVDRFRGRFSRKKTFKIQLSDDFPLITFIEGTRLNGILGFSSLP